jgi:Trypsin
MNEKQSSQILKKDDIYAYLGRFDLTKTVNEPNSKKENVNKIVIHPDWKPNEVRYDADIALLQLENPTTFSDLIQPVCLPQSNLNVFALTGRVVGWGKSENSGKHELKPKQVEIPSYGNEDCFFADYKFAQFGSPRTFCAGERGKTPCQGESKIIR